jgi:hypothetical protein
MPKKEIKEPRSFRLYPSDTAMLKDLAEKNGINETNAVRLLIKRAHSRLKK